MQKNKNIINNIVLQIFFIVANPTHFSKPKHSYFCKV